ncbi:MAG: 6-carboxytetrahydropterin synthase [Rikenellaceae bacterium]
MSKIRLTKEFSFEMAHTLEGYDGACSQIHGHSYRFFVTVIGEPLNDENNPKNGMLIDFGQIKAIVNKTIIDRYDHTLVIRQTSENEGLISTLKSHYRRIETVDYQPTCENMISRFAEYIIAELPERVKLHSLKMHETASSYAEWWSSDNI